jgi:hypothetical protein
MPEKARVPGLSRRICDLNLTVPGSRLEKLVLRLYTELEEKGISYRPPTYLSDEWGCPHRVPIIGIPFYLAQKGLAQLETRLSGVPAETEDEIMLFLRHEAGHAINYAFRLYQVSAWQKLFGDFSQPYHEVYRARPFSAGFVRHVPAWYAQKHPDEDFAETFAIWLTPHSRWKKTYAGTPALKKLLYVDKIMRRLSDEPPEISHERPDRPVEELTITLAAWFATRRGSTSPRIKLPRVVDLDLQRLFADSKGPAAEAALQKHRYAIIRMVNDWTGLDRHLLSTLLDAVFSRIRSLGLKIGTPQRETQLANFAAFITAMAMNYQDTGRFVDE